MAYPPKNLKDPAITTHLQVGLINISAAALKNNFNGDAFFFSASETVNLFLTSYLPLTGSCTKIRQSILANIPIYPIIAKVHLQPTPVMNNIVNDERAPPIYIPSM